MSDNDFIKQAYEKIQSNLSDKAKLLAVSKYQSIEKIKYLASLGQDNFGENYLQELEQKAIEMPELNWHFIGSIQSKKIKHIVKYANTIQSVEKFEHLEKINKYASQLSKQISVFLQINIDDDVNKSGFGSNQIDSVVDCVEKSSELESVNVIGLMCLPTKSSTTSKSFDKMQKFYAEVNLMLNGTQKLTELSMGMSGDYLEAINYSSTMVRVGSSLFGERVK
ncbi:YggS family pyridoxal phosphate-dependent enzyme [Francisellaceae bacterium CB299]|jgi:pyridoxal phosphate enzyme (YggS family)